MVNLVFSLIHSDSCWCVDDYWLLKLFSLNYRLLEFEKGSIQSQLRVSTITTREIGIKGETLINEVVTVTVLGNWMP